MIHATWLVPAFLAGVVFWHVFSCLFLYERRKS